MIAKDIAGKKFGMLTAIHRGVPHQRYKQARWLFKCECGEEKLIFGYLVWGGKIKSCGCYMKSHPSNLRHGLNGTREHRSWTAMRGRCLNKSNSAYPDYGGRGITICQRWNSFENFYADMGKCPDGKTLDRRDNNGNYEPSNCRWATRKEQVRNRRISGKYSFNGKSQSLSAWAEEMNLPYWTIWTRYKNGWRGNKLFSKLGPTSGKK